jgi:hypothetical protein
MRKLSSALVAAAMIAAVASPAPVHAQLVSTSGSWTNMITPTNGGTTFWDNSSLDGQNCNIGFFLVYPAGGGFGPCNNQAPTDPFVQANAGKLGSGGSFLSNDAFTFAAGSYRVEFLANIAGYQPPSQELWINTAGNVQHTQLYAVGTYPNALTTVFHVDIGSAWYLSAKSVNGNLVYSNSANPDFALFSSTAVNGVSPGGLNDVMFVGYGDRAGDNDFQDLVVRITAVPEPSTYLTLGLGLGVMGLLYRRRRTA